MKKPLTVKYVLAPMVTALSIFCALLLGWKVLQPLAPYLLIGLWGSWAVGRFYFRQPVREWPSGVLLLVLRASQGLAAAYLVAKYTSIVLIASPESMACLLLAALAWPLASRIRKRISK